MLESCRLVAGIGRVGARVAGADAEVVGGRGRRTARRPSKLVALAAAVPTWVHSVSPSSDCSMYVAGLVRRRGPPRSGRSGCRRRRPRSGYPGRRVWSSRWRWRWGRIRRRRWWQSPGSSTAGSPAGLRRCTRWHRPLRYQPGSSRSSRYRSVRCGSRSRRSRRSRSG